MANKLDLWSRRSVLATGAGLLIAGLPGRARTEPAAGQPVKIGQTLSLTGPLAQTGLVHRIASEIFVDKINASGGLLGHQVQYTLLDDQSKPDVARTLYERLITSDKVDLVLGPYATAAILAAMGVAQRYRKVFIENTMGIPELATYEWHFAAVLAGAEPGRTGAEIELDCYASTGRPPKTVFIAVTKFPSAIAQAKGMNDVAVARGLKVVEYVDYDFGTRDFGAIAARVKDANPDLLWVGALGVDGNLLLDSLSRLDYKPRRHFYLYPSSAPLAVHPAAESATSGTYFEDIEPYISNPDGAEFAREFRVRAEKAGLPYPHADGQAALEYRGWPSLATAINATKSFDDAKLANWLDNNEVDTITGHRDFKGKWHQNSRDMTQIRQIQGGKWVTVWPPDRATPGSKLVAP